MFVIDILNEGLHIDDVTGVILLRNTKSLRIFYQQIGRAIQSGNLESPIIFDFVNNFNNICTGDFIDDLEEAKLRKCNKRAAFGLEDNCPLFTIIDETKETKELFEELENKLNDIWEYWYDKLVEYNDTHETSMVSREENEELYYWCSRQRNSYNKEKLPEDRVDSLKLLNFIWDFKNYKWFQMYQKLKDYKSKNNDCKVPKRYIDDSQLFFGVGTQRKKNHMTKERLNALDELGFDWGDDERWKLEYEGLKKFKEISGHFDVPRDYKSGGVYLFDWLLHQRVKYNGGDEKRKSLTEK